MLNLFRVSTQVSQCLIKSYIGFSIDKALQSLILGFFDHKGLIKSFFLLKIFQHWEMDFLSWKLH